MDVRSGGDASKRVLVRLRRSDALVAIRARMREVPHVPITWSIHFARIFLRMLASAVALHCLRALPAVARCARANISPKSVHVRSAPERIMVQIEEQFFYARGMVFSKKCAQQAERASGARASFRFRSFGDQWWVSRGAWPSGGRAGRRPRGHIGREGHHGGEAIGEN